MMRPIQTVLGLLLLAGPIVASPPNTDDAPLNSVYFVDSIEGWAVGADGLILHSIDGGKNWERQPSGSTAQLNDIYFATPYIGWVAGEIALDSDIGTGGVILATANGGANWFELSRNRLPGLSAVQFKDVKTGIVTTKGEPQGVLHATTDGGITWQNAGPAPKLSEFVQSLEGEHGRFRNLCAVGEDIWAVGRPGSVIYHSPDSGKTWTKQVTPIRVPLNAVQFLDAKTGWAVGDLGNILKTVDGGRTWIVQRGGSDRAAVLGLFAEPSGIPAGTIAKLANVEGYRTVALNAAPMTDSALSIVTRKLGTAASDNLGQTAWADYMREPSAKDEPALLPTRRDNDLLAEMVLAIRIWQPDVVLTDRLDASATVAEKLMLLHARDAFEKAGDSTAFPEQLTQFGLKPHRASKLYAQTTSESDASVNVVVNDNLKDVVRQVSNFTEAPMPIVERFRLLAHRLEIIPEGGDLMSGIDIRPGSGARRDVEPADSDIVAVVDSADIEIKTLSERHATATITADDLRATAKSIGSHPDAEATCMARRIADALQTLGAWTAAREMHAMIANRYSAQPGGVESFRWLLKYHTSGEMVRRIENGEFPVYQNEIFAKVAEPAVVQAGHTDSPTESKYRFLNPIVERQWNQYALDLEPKLGAFGLIYLRSETTQLPLQVARRRAGLLADARKYAELFAESTTAYRLENNILHNNLTTNDKQVVRCIEAEERPTLDGRLDEKCWLKAKPTTIHLPGDTKYQGSVKFCYDSDYLYVGVACSHPSQKEPTALTQRQRDANMLGQDRVIVELDIDRDYQTSYQLSVDCRGQAHDACCGDASWNPRWHIAHSPSALGWTIEAAIPLTELTGEVVTVKTTWAVRLQRLFPGMGQSSNDWQALKFVPSPKDGE